MAFQRPASKWARLYTFRAGRGERGPDLNRIAWQAERRVWANQRVMIVCPSQGLARCARESVLFNKVPLHVIPSPIDTNFPWRPIPRDSPRGALGLPEKPKLIRMGAEAGVSDPRKGGDLFHAGIEQVLAKESGTIELVIFGLRTPTGPNRWPCKVQRLGAVRDDRVLALAYSAADVMVVPSRHDNLTNTALEAQPCGTPLVAFNSTGLPDVVGHKETGYLAEPYSADDLAEGIRWVLGDRARQRGLSRLSGERAVTLFGNDAVARRYAALYEQLIGTSH
jgi:glycosyltransferase involved in cell wall biosynthesis